MRGVHLGRVGIISLAQRAVAVHAHASRTRENEMSLYAMTESVCEACILDAWE